MLANRCAACQAHASGCAGPTTGGLNEPCDGTTELTCAPLTRDAGISITVLPTLASVSCSSDAMEIELAADVIRLLAPECSDRVYECLAQERVRSACDLAGLDKDDLRELGLTMVERSRVVSWAKTRSCNIVSEINARGPTRAELPRKSSKEVDRGSIFRKEPSEVLFDAINDVEAQGRSAEARLDEIESHAEFWCSCFVASQELGLLRRCPSQSFDCPDDVREDLLEELYDCTPERVQQVFASMDRDADGRVSSVEELQDGLRRCGLFGLGGNTLSTVLATMTNQSTGALHLREFEALLTRLRLAQLFLKPFDASLVVLDYNVMGAFIKHITPGMFRDFCFGHRPRPNSPNESPLVRWVRLTSFSRHVLFALMVKYTLHPLGVEDVLEQCTTKIDKYGRHYFLAIELLCTANESNGRRPIHVWGQHVTVFCAGPPLLDTLITITQIDRSFKKDWPGGARACDTLSLEDAWLDKLQSRLKKEGSRIRERRADFLLYSVIDLCVDQLVKVTNAYMGRLTCLEEELRLRGDGSMLDLGEVSLCRLQLAVVIRRLRGLQRVVRRLADDTDLYASGLSGYWQDCADHLDEAHDDAVHLAERCAALTVEHQRAMDKRDEEDLHIQHRKQEVSTRRLNTLLFFLTTATTLFAPLQLLAGIYGMNFQDSNGTPTIPELLWPNGYKIFCITVVVYIPSAMLLSCCLYYRVNRSTN